MMKYTMIFLLALVATACGGGGSNMPSIDDITEGDGPTLSVSTDATTTSTVVKDVLFAVADAVGKGIEDANSSAQEEQDLLDLCQKGSSDLSSGPITINGNSGTVRVTSEGTANRTNDTGFASQTSTAEFTAYGFTGITQKSYAVSGDVDYGFEADVDAGLNAMCDELTTAKHEGEDDIAIHQVVTETLTGGLSISGTVGAAVTFNVTAITDAEAKTITYDGDAVVKSNNITTDCTISGTVDSSVDANSFESLTVDCQ